ncbi:MAG: hypothetical protein KJO35_04765, partial [Gammaproteobacteria bacterium]|nr:hypothetical protein [Gammaproteobacteria bacterium]
MNDLFYNKAGRLFLIDVIAIALVLLLIPVITVASDDAGENRISYSDNLYSNGESGGDKQPDVAKKNKSRNGVTAQNINGAFRIYDAWVQLYFDDDRDGYFYGIDVVFDADTDYF